MTAGRAALSHRPKETGCPVWPLPGQGQLWTHWHTGGQGLAKLPSASPGVFLYSVPAGLEDLIFLILYISCRRPEQQKEASEVLPAAVQDVPLEHSGPPNCCGLGAKPLGTHTFQQQTPQLL